MAGRTHGQHVVPATFGYKVANWIDELVRHVERLQQTTSRLFVAMLGGGVGNPSTAPAPHACGAACRGPCPHSMRQCGSQFSFSTPSNTLESDAGALARRYGEASR